MSKKNLSLASLMKKAMKMALAPLIAAYLATSQPAPGFAAGKIPVNPNLIFILADDAGYGDFGVYGQKEIKTPNLDRMAEEGIIFTSHYAGSTVCAPSRSSLLTGKHTGHTFIRGNKEIISEGQYPLSPEVVTLAEVLKTAGMTTGIVGKWGLGGPGSSGEPNRQGFDEWFGYLCQRQAHDYYPDYLWENGQKGPLDGQTYSHDLFTDRALQFIRNHQQKLFFLYLPYTIPHAALQVPDLEPYQDRDWNENKKKYAAMITRMDTDVGRILSLLKEMGIDRNTLVLFSSDNGPHAEGGADPSFFNSAGPFRGKKRDLYEGGIRVPLIARWPGVITAGRTTDHLSAFWDILPTFAELAGVEPPSDIDGISLVPTLVGDTANQPQHDHLYWEFHEFSGAQAVRKGKWKGIRKGIRFDAKAPIELYNLEADPGENHDLSLQHPEIVKELSDLMEGSRMVSNDFPLLEKKVFHFGPYSAWVFSSVMLGLTLVLGFLEGLVRKRSIMTVFRNTPGIGKAILCLYFTVTVLLYAVSVFLPIWGGTIWFDMGLYVALAGVGGYLISRIYFLVRKPDPSLMAGVYKLSAYFSEFFIILFWTGLAIATVTPELGLLIATLAGLRYLISRFQIHPDV